METQTGKPIRPAEVAVLLVFLLPLLAHLYVGQFSRLVADDFCTTNIAREHGVFGSVGYWYTTWAGQFTNWFIKGVAGQFGVGFTRALPGLVLIGWFGAATWTFRQIGRALGVQRLGLGSMILAALVIYVTTDTASNIVQSLYWTGAVIPYTAPLIVVTVYMGFFARTLHHHPDGAIRPGALVIAFLLTFIGGGLSEVYAAFQTATLGLMGFICLIWLPNPRKRLALSLIAVGLVGSIGAMLIILAAPGNAVRRAFFPTSPSIPQTFAMTGRVALSFISATLVLFAPFAVLTALITSGVIAFQTHLTNRPSRGQIRWLLLGSGLVAIILGLSGIAPAIYAMSVAPPPRHYIIPQYALAVLVIVWGGLMGMGLKKYPTQRIQWRRAYPLLIVMAALLILGPVMSTMRILARAPDLQTWAREWDERDAQIRAASANGETDVVVEPFTVNMGEIARLDVVNDDPQSGMNQCAAAYYHVDSVRVRSN